MSSPDATPGLLGGIWQWLSGSIYAFGALTLALLPIGVVTLLVVVMLNMKTFNSLADLPTIANMCAQISDLRGEVLEHLDERANLLDPHDRAEFPGNDRFNSDRDALWTINVGTYNASTLTPVDKAAFAKVRDELTGSRDGKRLIDRQTVDKQPYRACTKVFEIPSTGSRPHKKEVYTVAWTEKRYQTVRESYIKELAPTRFRLSLVVGALVLLVSAAALWIQNALVGDSLRRLRHEIRNVAEGESVRLSANYPRELAPLASAFNSAMDSKERALTGTRNLITKIAHDLNNKLQAILGVIANDEINRKDLKRLVADIKTMLERYREISRSSQVEGADGWMRRKFEIVALLQDLLMMQRMDIMNREVKYALQVGETEVELKTDAPHPEIPVIGVEADVEIIFANLLTNASRYGGGAVLVTIIEDGRDVVVDVDDDGPGIPLAKREMIFLDGARLDVDQEKPGTGMGLGIVLMICGVAGGSAEVDTSPRLGGARFRVRLPIRRTDTTQDGDGGKE